MADNRRVRELEHFKRTYKTFIPNKVTKEDLCVAFIKGYNASDMQWRGKETEAEYDEDDTGTS